MQHCSRLQDTHLRVVTPAQKAFPHVVYSSPDVPDPLSPLPVAMPCACSEIVGLARAGGVADEPTCQLLAAL